MTYAVMLHPKADNFFQGIENDLEHRIKLKLKSLASNPERGKKLKYSDYWRLRIGDYRAIYEIDHETERIIVLFIGHRKDVYDDFSRLI